MVSPIAFINVDSDSPLVNTYDKNMFSFKTRAVDFMIECPNSCSASQAYASLRVIKKQMNNFTFAKTQTADA